MNYMNRKFIKSAESYGWVVDSEEAWEAYDMACELIGKEEVNQAIVDSMGIDELAESLAFLFKEWDFTEWDERNGEIESGCHGGKKKGKKLVKSDLDEDEEETYDYNEFYNNLASEGYNTDVIEEVLRKNEYEPGDEIPYSEEMILRKQIEKQSW